MWEQARPGETRRPATRADQTRPFDREQGGQNWEILGAAHWNSGEDGWLSTLYHGPRSLPIPPLPFPLVSRKGPRLSHDLCPKGARKGHR